MVADAARLAQTPTSVLRTPAPARTTRAHLLREMLWHRPGSSPARQPCRRPEDAQGEPENESTPVHNLSVVMMKKKESLLPADARPNQNRAEIPEPSVPLCEPHRPRSPGPRTLPPAALIAQAQWPQQAR